MDWNQIDQVGTLDDLINESEEKTVMIFKHSTRCSISFMALNRVERSWNLDGEVKPYLLDLLSHRDISNAIADKFGVVHQSPQILLIKKGEAFYSASHGAIDVASISEQLA